MNTGPGIMVICGFGTLWQVEYLLWYYKSNPAFTITQKQFNVFGDLNKQPELNPQNTARKKWTDTEMAGRDY